MPVPIKERMTTAGKRTATFLKECGHGLHRRTTLPLMERTHAWLSQRLDGETPQPEPHDDLQAESPDDPHAETLPVAGPEWKEKTLEDFNAWLQDLPDELPEGDENRMEACDLFTLLSEFSALRQEIRLQNREQNNAARVQQGLIGDHKEIADLFRSRTRDLSVLEEKIRLTSEKNAVRPFLDLRDALERGLLAARKTAATRSLFRKPPESVAGVVEGYEMALRRFDRALSHVGISRLETKGLFYDPSTMRAVERREDPEAERGRVLEERLSGFMRGSEVIRTAEVVVCQ